MKQICLSLMLSLVTIIGVNSTVKAQTEFRPKMTTGPQIKIDKIVHDYGTIEQGADGECIFTITNSGTDALIISLCKGTCGCTVPVCPKEAIAPGESVKIPVRYDTKRVGPINKSVIITSNAINTPKAKVRIKGKVVSKSGTTTPVNKVGPTNH